MMNERTEQGEHVTPQSDQLLILSNDPVGLFDRHSNPVDPTGTRMFTPS